MFSEILKFYILSEGQEFYRTQLLRFHLYVKNHQVTMNQNTLEFKNVYREDEYKVNFTPKVNQW